MVFVLSILYHIPLPVSCIKCEETPYFRAFAGFSSIAGTVSPEFSGFLGGTGKGFLSTVTSNSGRLRAFLLLARFHVRRGKGLRQKMTSIATSTCRLLQLTFAICNLPEQMCANAITDTIGILHRVKLFSFRGQSHSHRLDNFY